MLIIAEKYRMAKLLSSVLGFQYRYPFFYKDNDAGGIDIIAYAQGHLYQLEPSDPTVYDWNTPINFNALPKQYRFIPSHDENSDASVSVGGKSKRKLLLNDLRHKLNILLNEQTVIVNACDSERAGEHIFFEIFNAANVTNKEVLRLDLSKGITRSLILDAFDNMQPAKNYMGGYFASVAQTISDYHYALLTQVLTYFGRHNMLHEILCGYNDAGLSVVSTGRVQAALLFLIKTQSLATEKEFEKNLHEPVLIAKVGGRHLKFTLDYKYHGLNRDVFNTPSIGETFINQCKKQNVSMVISDVQFTEIMTEAPSPFSTASLQEAIPDLTPSQTLDVLNELYLKGLITYPRTDSTNIEEDDFKCGNAANRLDAVLNNLQGNADVANKISNINLSILPECAKSLESEAHTALIPTAGQRDISQLSENEQMVYKTIANRYIDAQQPLASHTAVIIKAKLDKPISVLGESDTTFNVEAVVNQSIDSIPSSKNVLFNLSEGDSFVVTEGRIDNFISKQYEYYKVSELPIVMKRFGIGTAATRHTFLDKLLKRRYVETFKLKKDHERVFITSKGLALLDSLNDKFKLPDVTAEWEQKLHDIEKEKDPIQAEIKAMAFIKQKQKMVEKFIQHLNQCQGQQRRVFEQSIVTQSKKAQLSQTGIKTDGDTFRDVRSIMLRQRYHKQGLLDLPPSDEQLERAKRLGQYARMRMDVKAKTNAELCQAFIEKAKGKISPTKIQIKTYRSLCAKLHIAPDSKILEFNGLLQKEIRRLEIIKNKRQL